MITAEQVEPGGGERGRPQRSEDHGRLVQRPRDCGQEYAPAHGGCAGRRQGAHARHLGPPDVPDTAAQHASGEGGQDCAGGVSPEGRPQACAAPADEREPAPGDLPEQRELVEVSRPVDEVRPEYGQPVPGYGPRQDLLRPGLGFLVEPPGGGRLILARTGHQAGDPRRAQMDHPGRAIGASGGDGLCGSDIPSLELTRSHSRPPEPARSVHHRVEAAGEGKPCEIAVPGADMPLDLVACLLQDFGCRPADKASCTCHEHSHPRASRTASA